jgi:hypothetical protein
VDRNQHGQFRARRQICGDASPAFDEASRAGDIFKEEAEAAVLGLKTPEAAMASVVQRVKPLLPA